MRVDEVMGMQQPPVVGEVAQPQLINPLAA